MAVSRKGPLSTSALRRMLASMRHRGPDDEGIAEFGSVVMGHTRLSIIDLSQAGSQPMLNEDGLVCIVFNGEIYNFAELRVELDGKGYRFRSRTDTEVALHAYEEWGEKCVEKFRGMFSLAIYDNRKPDASRLFLARDRVGIKPLYYWCDGKSFLFASEIRAILASGIVPKCLDQTGLMGYLTLGSVPSPHTILDGVKCLRPGHTMTVQLSRQKEEIHIKKKQYWTLNFKPGKLVTEQDAIENVREILDESVRMRLVADVPVGAFLSGGIDSSAVVSQMRRHATGSLRTFSITFPETAYNERNYALMAARRFGTEHTDREVTGEEVANKLERIVAAMDQPTIDGVNTYFVSEVTRESGTIVALSGVGGDEVFCGYSTFNAVPRLAHWQRRLRWLPGGVKRVLASSLFGQDVGRSIRLNHALASEPSLESSYFAARGLFVPEEARLLLHKAGECNGEYFDPTAYLQANTSFRREEPLLNKVSELEISSYLHNQLLRDTDAMSMNHSLEVRVPLLDHKLIENVSSIPVKYKVGSDSPKRLLVKAMGSELPPELTNRPKRTFTFPFDVWMRGSLKRTCEDVLLGDESDSPLALQRLQVEAVWKSYMNKRMHWSRPWSLVALKLWCARYLQ